MVASLIKYLLPLLFLSSFAFGDTPPQVINKTCITNNWISSITPGHVPVCSGFLSTPGKLAYFDTITGQLTGLPDWIIEPWFGLSANLTLTAPIDASDLTQFGFNDTVNVVLPQTTTLYHPEGFHVDLNIDPGLAGNSLESANGMVVTKSLLGNGTIDISSALNLTDTIGSDANAGTLILGNGINLSATLGATYIGVDYNLLNESFTDNGAITDILTLMNFSTAGSGTLQAFQGLNYSGALNTVGTWNGIQLINTANIGSSGEGVSISQQGNVGGSFIGVATQAIGDVTGNAVGVFSGFANGTVSGNIVGMEFFNSSTNAPGNDIFGFDLGNSGNGNNFTGGRVFNSGNMTGFITGFQVLLEGNTSSASGMNIFMDTSATNDNVGANINMQNASSSTQKPISILTNGGIVSENSTYTPISNNGFDVGNLYSSTATAFGSPLVGSDMLVTSIQSNLQAFTSVNTGSFGFDTNMLAVINQIGLDTGINIPLVRSMLLGTEVTSLAGGTIPVHVVLELMGLPSFGGTVSNPTRIGIQDSQLLSQNFCDGATNCWFIREQDPNAFNSFAGPVNSNNGLQLTTSGSQPSCDVAHRGMMWNIQGGAGVADLFQVCQKDAADIYNWVTK